MEKPVSREYLDKSLEKLARMVKKGFDGVDKGFESNRKEHQRIFERLDKMRQS